MSLQSRMSSVSQSSMGHGGDTKRAVDGNIDNNWGLGNCTHTHTNDEGNPWWQIDLGTEPEIKEVEVTNRGTAVGTDSSISRCLLMVESVRLEVVLEKEPPKRLHALPAGRKHTNFCKKKCQVTF